MELTLTTPKGSKTITQEYPIYPDDSCLFDIEDQIWKARILYNDIIACIRGIYNEMQEYILSKCPPEIIDLKKAIDEFTEAFKEAKALNDESRMKKIAERRSELWTELSIAMKAIRTQEKKVIQENFLSKIGRASKCPTYQLRSKAVDNGLGWATANNVLERALIAFQKSFSLGKAPKFCRAEMKTQDTLILQFTDAGGVLYEHLTEAKKKELILNPGALKPWNSNYFMGQFKFRLGTATEDKYAFGAWKSSVWKTPENSHVALARLVRRRVGVNTYKWSLQLVVKLPEIQSAKLPLTPRHLLATVHFGWASDETGRRVAAIASSSNPKEARLIQLPVSIEEKLDWVSSLNSRRATNKEECVRLVKLIDPKGMSDVITTELQMLSRLPASYVSYHRLHSLHAKMTQDKILPEWLDNWAYIDTRLCREEIATSKAARNIRKNFYRNLASELATQYQALVIEPLNLAYTAKKVNEKKGEKTEFSQVARSGRVVAALYELEMAIRNACEKNNTALLELSGKTVHECSACGSQTQEDKKDRNMLHCFNCGLHIERKFNAATNAYKFSQTQVEGLIEDYHLNALNAQRQNQEDKTNRLQKMAQARIQARLKKNEDKQQEVA